MLSSAPNDEDVLIVVLAVDDDDDDDDNKNKWNVFFSGVNKKIPEKIYRKHHNKKNCEFKDRNA